MKKVITSFALFCSILISAQKNTSLIVTGTNYTLESKILKQERDIQVYLPDSYYSSEKKYPVLYILDGQWFFANAVAIQKSLRSPIALPEMIVVGIKTENATRRPQYGRESVTFTAFLKNEVIDFVDANFRTTNERIIFGWEAAAYYVSDLILKDPNTFSGAIVTDGGLSSENVIKNFSSEKEIYLFIANSKKDIFYLDSTEKFNDRLKKYQPKNLRWTYRLFNDEVHQSLPQLSLYKGLKYYYHNYDSPMFESIQSYKDAGGIQYLKSFFKERAKRFGGNPDIDDNTKNSLIWLAWNRNNFEYFSFFMEEFKDVLKTKRYASAYWQNRLGQFYLKHKDYKNAKIFFERGISMYPGTRFDADMKKGLKEATKKMK